MSNKEIIAKPPSGRVKRTPIGTRNILTITGKDPEYEYRVVNDMGDRVEQFKQAGYEVVSANDVKVGDNRITSTSPEGSVAQVSVGGGTKAIVMRIRKEWYDEDQREKQKLVDEREAAMKQKAHDGTYGTFEIKRD